MFRRKAKKEDSKAAMEEIIVDDPYIEEYVYREWHRADTDKSGKLDKGEVKSLLKKLNVRMKGNEFDARFKRADDNKSGELDFQEFRKFLEELRERAELKPLYESYAKEKGYLDAQDLVTFITNEQKEQGATLEDANKIINDFSHSDKGMMGFLAFCDYLNSSANSAYNSTHTTSVYHDMTQPLTHYYIASSHNTYLMGHQLQGESSIEAYKYCFKLGCKCVELDCWDGDNGEPIITHGHTIVSKIPFRAVIETVRDFAFSTSPYPVTLSLENHCSLPQQLKMAEILKEVLGDRLALAFDDHTKPLPSPEALKGKVLIKGKKLKKDGALVVEEEESEEEEDDVEDDGDSDDEKPKKKPEPKKVEKIKKEVKKKAHAVAQELSFITHFASGAYGGFEKDKDLLPWDMSSFSELSVKKYHKTGADSFIDHNNKFFSRTYPKGTRFDSSNFSGILSWALGCHMIALNWQTGDIHQMINIGKFLDNGKSGYVLKPKSLLPNRASAPPAVPVNVNIKVVSGWQLPKTSGTAKGEVIDPYVKVKLFGVGTDKFRGKTKTISNNGFNPVWNENINFNVTQPDLAVILIQVYDEDTLSKDDFIAYAAIPVNSLREGYRCVHLYNKQSELLADSSLMVNINLNRK